jgi:predicted alpha/beta hydrolase
LNRRNKSEPTFETIDIRTRDGWSLRADVHRPQRPAHSTGRGVAVLAHAMMARRSEFDRPEGQGMVAFLVERGWRVVSFDFRGHGDSRPTAREGGRYSYDDLVAGDLPTVCAFARSEAGTGGRVVLLGHSLGGHTALAAQGAGLIDLDAVVALGATIWLRELDPSPSRWWVKRAIMEGMLRLSLRAGRFPARALRLGSDDEALPFVQDVGRFTRDSAWTSADGTLDYLAGLGRVRVPVLQVTSDGDRLECAPECGARFVGRCAGPREWFRVTQADDGGPAPSHMGLVTSGRVKSVWQRAESWMRAGWS